MDGLGGRVEIEQNLNASPCRARHPPPSRTLVGSKQCPIAAAVARVFIASSAAAQHLNSTENKLFFMTSSVLFLQSWVGCRCSEPIRIDAHVTKPTAQSFIKPRCRAAAAAPYNKLERTNYSGVIPGTWREVGIMLTHSSPRLAASPRRLPPHRPSASGKNERQ